MPNGEFMRVPRSQAHESEDVPSVPEVGEGPSAAQEYVAPALGHIGAHEVTLGGMRGETPDDPEDSSQGYRETR